MIEKISSSITNKHLHESFSETWKWNAKTSPIDIVGFNYLPIPKERECISKKVRMERKMADLYGNDEHSEDEKSKKREDIIYSEKKGEMGDETIGKEFIWDPSTNTLKCTFSSHENDNMPQRSQMELISTKSVSGNE